jgi:hypothetical protein
MQPGGHTETLSAVTHGTTGVVSGDTVENRTPLPVYERVRSLRTGGARRETFAPTVDAAGDFATGLGQVRASTRSEISTPVRSRSPPGLKV